MKKVRVLKEMPFAKVGKELEIIRDGSSIVFEGTCWGILQVEKLIKEGWLEWVEEEKSLEEKMLERSGTAYVDTKELAQIAKTHYLEEFDKEINNRHYPFAEHMIKSIRKILENA